MTERVPTTIADFPDQEVLDRAAQIYWDGRSWTGRRWAGVWGIKNPFDLWAMQEIITEVRPDLIIECGSLYGASAVMWSMILEQLGNGRVLAIDIADQFDDARALPAAHRIDFLIGSSVDPATVAEASRRASDAERVMVVLDSDHSRAHVLAELEAYGPLVTPGSYLVVEDGHVNGHPVQEFGLGSDGGPFEAVTEFLASHPEFSADRSREGLITWSPHGYLRLA